MSVGVSYSIGNRFGVSVGNSLRCVLAVVALLSLASLSAAAQDTVRSLDAIEVTAQQPPASLHTATPTQVVDATTIERMGAVQLSDAVRQMAGVVLKDYGGVGGMKTVSARGLGSQFSTVTIDGVAISDAQNGQVDMGRYLLGNAAYVSFCQGQQGGALLSARSYAAGNVLNIETVEPVFFLAQRTNLRLAAEGGSFGMLCPQALWEQKWSDRVKTSLWLNYLQSHGNYPFTLYYTASHSDSSSREYRHHSAMRMFTTDANLFYSISRSDNITAKLHYIGGWHQLPGPVQYYNQTLSAQSTREEVAFAQAKWRHEKGRWRSQLLGKMQSSLDVFEDSAANTLSRYQKNTYLQHEAYLSGAATCRAFHWLDVSVAIDGNLAKLNTNLSTRNDVNRQGLMAVAALRLHKQDSLLNAVELNANLLGTSIRDRVSDLDTMPLYRRLSPYVGVNVTFGGVLTLRYFYKETFRAPVFSELYFFTLPRELQPERARQHNLGITFASHNFSATVDAYHNHVTDKILAIPTQNMFLWSMQNVGRVEVDGIDATVKGSLGSLDLQLNYSYQRALDRSDSASRTFGHQIAYTPRHSGGALLTWDNRWFTAGISAMLVGTRYYRMLNNDDTRMPAYCDLGLTVGRQLDLPCGTLHLQLQVLNMLNVQYEVVRSYPMMGRNYRIKITLEI